MVTIDAVITAFNQRKQTLVNPFPLSREYLM